MKITFPYTDKIINRKESKVKKEWTLESSMENVAKNVIEDYLTGKFTEEFAIGELKRNNIEIKHILRAIKIIHDVNSQKKLFTEEEKKYLKALIENDILHFEAQLIRMNFRDIKECKISLKNVAEENNNIIKKIALMK